MSPTKTLSDRELTLIFEYLTQHNQVDSIESIYADVYHEPKKEAAPAPKTADKGPQSKPAQPQHTTGDKTAVKSAGTQQQAAGKPPAPRRPPGGQRLPGAPGPGGNASPPAGNPAVPPSGASPYKQRKPPGCRQGDGSLFLCVALQQPPDALVGVGEQLAKPPGDVPTRLAVGALGQGGFLLPL